MVANSTAGEEKEKSTRLHKYKYKYTHRNTKIHEYKIIAKIYQRQQPVVGSTHGRRAKEKSTKLILCLLMFHNRLSFRAAMDTN